MAGEGCSQRRLEQVLREKERKDSPAVKWQGPREGMKSKRIQDCAGGTGPWTACPYSTTPDSMSLLPQQDCGGGGGQARTEEYLLWSCKA